MKYYQLSEQVFKRMEDDLNEIQTKLTRSFEAVKDAKTKDEALKNGALNPVQYAYESGRGAMLQKLIEVIKISDLRKKN